MEFLAILSIIFTIALGAVPCFAIRARYNTPAGPVRASGAITAADLLLAWLAAVDVLRRRPGFAGGLDLNVWESAE